MKPVYLDTSVVLRILTGQPEDLARTAEKAVCQAVNAGRTVVVPDLVIMEAYFALQYHYGVTKTAALRNLKALLQENGVRPENGDTVIVAMDAVLMGASKPGLVDRLIHARAVQADAEFYTIEKPSHRLPGTRVLG